MHLEPESSNNPLRCIDHNRLADDVSPLCKLGVNESHFRMDPENVAERVFKSGFLPRILGIPADRRMFRLPCGESYTVAAAEL